MVTYTPGHPAVAMLRLSIINLCFCNTDTVVVFLRSLSTMGNKVDFILLISLEHMQFFSGLKFITDYQGRRKILGP